MSDSILDNQEVTAEMLNDIAVDLGKADFSEFSNDTPFGADKLNSITSALVGKGVLNSGGCCRPELSGSTLIINDGVIVFESGAKMKIEQNISVLVQPNSYIYAVNNTTANICQIVVTSTGMTSGDYVAIAEVDADGRLIDKRLISKSKVELKVAPGAIPVETGATTFVFKQGQQFEYLFNIKTEAFSLVLNPAPRFGGKAYVDLSSPQSMYIDDHCYFTFAKQGASLKVVTGISGYTSLTKTGIELYVI